MSKTKVLRITLLLLAIILYINIVDARCCKKYFDTNCCGKCPNGKECSERGNSHNLKCNNCNNVNYGGCNYGWAC